MQGGALSVRALPFNRRTEQDSRLIRWPRMGMVGLALSVGGGYPILNCGTRDKKVLLTHQPVTMLIRSLITLACALTAAASAIPAPIAEHELDERGRHARPPTVRVRPSDPHQCGNVRASWTGVPPFTVEFGLWRGPVKTHGGFLSRFGLYDTQKTSYDWTVIIPKGTPLWVTKR